MHEIKSLTSPPPSPSGPSFTVKLIVSLRGVFHRGCIIINVSAAGSPMAQGPRVLQQAFMAGGVVRGYLCLLFQTNAYRFYAPDPGPCDLLWVRFKYCDPDDPHREVVAVRWHETPSKDDHWMRMPYQRDLAVCMLMGMQTELMPHPSLPNAPPIGFRFNDLGQICFSSFMRHLAQKPQFAALTVPGRAKPLTLVDIDAFKVAHRVLSPLDVQVGRGYFDPRFYDIFFVGRFDAQGKQLTPTDEPFLQQDQVDMLARLVQEDLWPAAEQQKLDPNDKEKLAAFIRGVGVPKPFRAALESDAGYFKSGQTRKMLADRFMAFTQKDDNREELRKWKMLPQGSQPQFSLPQPTGMAKPQGSVR